MNWNKLILYSSISIFAFAAPALTTQASPRGGGSAPRGNFAASRGNFGASRANFAASAPRNFAGRGVPSRAIANSGRPGRWNHGNGNWNHGNGNWNHGNGNWNHGHGNGHHWNHHRHFYPYYAYNPFLYGYGFGYPYWGTSYYYDGYNRGYSGSSNGSVAVEVQQELAQAGYYHGAIDGVIGDGTRRAIRAYERSHRLPVDGRIDADLLATMGLS